MYDGVSFGWVRNGAAYKSTIVSHHESGKKVDGADSDGMGTCAGVGGPAASDRGENSDVSSAGESVPEGGSSSSSSAMISVR